MARSSADKTIRVWDIAARATVCTIQDTGEVWSVAWRPQLNTSEFVSGGEDGVVAWGGQTALRSDMQSGSRM